MVQTNLAPLFLPSHGIGNTGRFAGLAVLLALALAPGSSRAQLPSGTWQYAWGDDFSGNAVDGSKWNVASPDWTMPNSYSTAAASKVRLGEGVLTLDATRTATSGSVQFSSGSISTYQKQNFSGGYIEARIWLPDTPGSWPAFWGLYTGWPPEMDIMEYPIDTASGSGYSQDEYHTAFHYTNTSGSAAAGGGKVNPAGVGDLGGAWHTFAVNWVEDSSVTFYFDGQQVSSFGSGADVAEMASMYLMLDYAVGGTDWIGLPNTTEWPLGHTDQTKVDWVRVWKSAAAKTSNWIYTGTGEYVLWDTAANWSNGEPNLGGVTSSFGTVNAAAQRLDWSGSKMLSVINLDGGTRYRFGWPDDRLALGFGNSGSLQPAINLAATTTSEQEIYGVLEWSGILGINNDSAQPLLLTGKVMGGDGIAINGPGVVSFEGSDNTYSGTTVIDSGAAGPGIARVRGRRSLGFGNVVIGETGNATTARLELENNALVPNPVFLNGRTNDSAGIRNNSGTNTISGTIAAQSGGDRYWLQSDAGELRLTGDTALSSGAGGTRTFTLQGTGAGVVSGTVENGSASTVSLVKSGSGTWTLDTPNAYTGATTVSEGTLVVNGSTGSAATTVSNGATLGGRGTVKNNLTAQAGATVRMGANGLQPAYALVENFAAYPLGDIGPVPNTTGDVWTGVFNGTGNADIVDDGGNKALAVNGTNATSGWRGAITDLKNAYGTDFSLRHGLTGTYFFRVKSASPTTTDFIFGLTDQAASTTSAPGNDTTDPWNEYAVTLSIAGGNLRAYSAGAGDVAVTSIGASQWLNVWIVVDNAAKTYRVATSTGTADGTLSPTVFNFGRRAAAAEALVTFGAHERANVVGQIDDLHFAHGTVLGNPLGAVAPLAAENLTVQTDFTLASGAVLEFDLANETLHDKLVVGGQFNASGTLRVTLDPGAPAPALGDSFDLFDAGGGTVNFASFELPTLAEGLKWDTRAIGTGVLGVVADAASYAGWALGYSFAPGTEGPSFDVEPDGLPNAFEWLFGSDPFASDPAYLPQGELRAVTGTEFPGADPARKYLSLTATIRKNISGMSLIPQANHSLDLLDDPGSSASVVSLLRNDLGDFEEREWIYTVPIEDAASGFMRLKLMEE